MGAPRVTPKTSLSDATRPTTNSVPGLQGTSQFVSSGRTAGSPEESNTSTQHPHDAIFMYKRAAN